MLGSRGFNVNVSLRQSNLVITMLVLLVASCQSHGPGSNGVDGAPALTAIDLSEPAHITAITGPVAVHLAKNAWADVSLQVRLRPSSRAAIQLPDLVGVSTSAYQVLPVKVNLDTAYSVRQTGDVGGIREVPRVLLPLPIADGAVDLSAARSVGDQPILIYFELHSTSAAMPGSQNGSFDLSNDGRSIGSVAIQLAIENIDLQSQPRLTVAVPLGWNDLATLYPDIFEAVTPRLLHRGDPQDAALVDLLGQYISLAHENYVSAYIPRLQPIVKWPTGRPAEADWSDYDSMISPWLNGTGFSDHRPTGFWPLPEPDSLTEFDLAARSQYWRLALAHFAARNWINHTAALLHPSLTPTPIDIAAADLSAEARQILLADPKIHALLPLADGETILDTDRSPAGVPHTVASRLFTLSEGLVYPSPIRDWPSDVAKPLHWINTDQQFGSTSYIGVGNEQDIRTLAALAFIRNATLVHIAQALPKSGVPDDANQIVLFYPGQVYGVNHPLATLQLKWLRKAEQDFAYFHFAGRQDDVLKMCRLITQTVKLLPAQPPMPIDTLLAGGNDPQASEHACRLIADRYGRPRNIRDDKSALPVKDAVDLKTIRWFSDHQHPTLIPGAVRWSWPDTFDQPADQEPGRWIDAAISVDIYNPAEEMPNGNALQWTAIPSGWEIHPQPLEVPALAQFQIHRVVTHARFNLNRTAPESRQPMGLTFIDGFNGETFPFNLSLPVAISERRLHHLSLDGSLDDWDASDALLLEKPMVKMLNRPSLQSPTLTLADTKSSIYSAWSDDNFYIAFRLAGVANTAPQTLRNFVQYDSGRAWGEDLCEALIQPVYADNTIGPTLHIVCKPGGECIEQKSQPGAAGDDKWQAFEPAGVRYATGNIDPAQKIWRGELAIPWRAISSADHPRPELLRFNFIQHQQSTGASASWAGPIDQSRDDSLSGLILLREPALITGGTSPR